MASIKGGLLDRLGPRRKNFGDLRLGAVCASLIVISLVFLCSNYPSKKTFLLRPNFSAVVPDSSVIDDAITPANHTLLTNLSLSLEIKESETLAARSAESFNRSLENLEMDAGNWSVHGRDESVNLGILLADRRKIGNSSDIGEIPLSYYSTQLAKKGDGDLPVQICDIFDGKWVRDDSKPYYPPESCPYIDEGFNCFLNGRPDDEYVKWRWQPNGCNLPHLNATDFLERLKGKKVVFVGDSLNRNMWESLVCILHHSVRDKKRVYEISGRTEFKKKGIYAFRFEEYNCSIDFVASPFLVRESLHSRENKTFETLRLDLMDRTTSMYQDADILIFNTGHWWTHDKTSKGEDYYQEGDYVHPRLKVLQAYEKALTTWGKWVDEHVDTNKTLVFFRGYSITHFRGGQWNSGGQCHRESEPIFNETYLGKYPSKMRALEKVLKTMKTRVIYLNISRMTDHRKDGHPSIYRKAYNTAQERLAAEQTQDCSHWCLPGVPDTWNALLYASLVGVENRAPRSVKN